MRIYKATINVRQLVRDDEGYVIDSDLHQSDTVIAHSKERLRQIMDGRIDFLSGLVGSTAGRRNGDVIVTVRYITEDVERYTL